MTPRNQIIEKVSRWLAADYTDPNQPTLEDSDTRINEMVEDFSKSRGGDVLDYYMSQTDEQYFRMAHEINERAKRA